MPARRCTHRGEPPLFIHGFADAAVAAAAISKVFAGGHVVVTTDAHGSVIDVLAFTRPTHTAEDAIAAGLDAHRRSSAACRMLVVSVLHGVDIVTPNDLEIEGWKEAADRCRRNGVELVDWIQCSGELLRSLSITAQTRHAR